MPIARKKSKTITEFSSKSKERVFYSSKEEAVSLNSKREEFNFKSKLILIFCTTNLKLYFSDRFNIGHCFSSYIFIILEILNLVKYF